MPDLLEGVTPNAINQAYLRATAPKPQLDLFHVTPVKLTVAETVESLIEELPVLGKTTLKHLTESSVDRVEVVIYFLAVLELYKQGVVDLTQIKTLGISPSVGLGLMKMRFRKYQHIRGLNGVR